MEAVELTWVKRCRCATKAHYKNLTICEGDTLTLRGEFGILDLLFGPKCETCGRWWNLLLPAESNNLNTCRK